MKSFAWMFELVEAKNILPDPDNPRIHTEKGMAQLGESLRRFGLAEPLILNPIKGSPGKFHIIGGHARYELQKDKPGPLRCMVPDRPLSREQARELMVRLNKNIAGEFDLEHLEEILSRDLLLGIGFETWELTLPADEDFHPGGGGGFGQRPGDVNPGYLIVQFNSREQFDQVTAWLGDAMISEHEADPARFLEKVLPKSKSV